VAQVDELVGEPAMWAALFLDRAVPTGGPTEVEDPWNPKDGKDDQAPVGGQRDGQRGHRPGHGVEEVEQGVEGVGDAAGVVAECLEPIQQFR
jgi:hypothetical protein